MNESFLKLSEKQIMALTIYGEARGESVEGKVAVGSVILERVEHRNWDGKTIHEVCLKPWQFSCFNHGDPNRGKLLNIAEMWDEAMAVNPALNDCYCIASGLIDGYVPRTKEIADSHATQYLTVGCDAAWEREMKKVAVIGRHEFYSEITGGDTVKKILIATALLMAVVGCSTMSYTGKDGTTVTYKRLFTGADAKVTMPDGTLIESQGAGLTADSLIGAIIKK